MGQINELDLAFVVDTTGSMGGLISAAQRQMIQMIDAVRRVAEVDLRLGVVEYRDHPPQDKMVYRTYELTSDLGRARRVINELRADGGGDAPEAVLDGVLAACQELAWRAHARRIAVLVGDAPPHGVPSERGRRARNAFADAFPDGCPCGETIESVTAAAEVAGVVVHALGMNAMVAESFTKLSRYTGGDYSPVDQGEAAMAKLEQILRNEFGNLELDASVLKHCAGTDDWNSDVLAVKLGSTPGAVSASVTRLVARGLLTIRNPVRPCELV